VAIETNRGERVIDRDGTRASEVKTLARVLVPVGMLGAGFAAGTVARGIALGADVIAVDGGSTDSGPYYLGAAQPKTTEEAVAHDLKELLLAARDAGIPMIVGSCGTGGTDAGVDWVSGIVRDIACEERLSLTVACIYSEVTKDRVAGYLATGRVHPLESTPELDLPTLRRCEHIVGLMGHEPIALALEGGANVVLAGRATDTAVLAAVPLMQGCPAGPVWHAAKVAECGALCTTEPRSGGVLIAIDAEGFTIEPLAPDARCTPDTVAAHMLYENADPFRMLEPGGILDASEAVYEALDDRRVRVTGSRFEPSTQYTTKLEGAAIAGYQTLSIAGIRDPEILDRIDVWHDSLVNLLKDGISRVLGFSPGTYSLEVRCYGWNAVLGNLDRDPRSPREVGAVLVVTAKDQAIAHTIAKYCNPYLLHMPAPGMSNLPSYAFMSSPAEIDRGPIFEFALNHVVDLRETTELTTTAIWKTP
jgi:hypothetical protein